jgi:hypothetical protein
MTEDVDMPDPDPNDDLKRAEERAKAEAAKLRAETDRLKAKQEWEAASQPQPDQNADLKKQEDHAKAEAGKIRAEADLIKAQTELAAANSQQPDPDVIASTAEKAHLDAQKGVLDSRKALADAQRGADLAAAQAAIGTVAGGGIEGTVTVKSDAGKGEATLLAARAIVLAAADIAKRVKPVATGRRIVVQSGMDAPQFASYRQFLLQQALLLRAFDTAQQEAIRLEQQAVALEALPPRAAAALPIPPLTEAGVLIDAVTKLGSYFLSNYEIGGIALTPDTAQLLASAAAALLSEGATDVVVLDRAVPRTADFDDVVKAVADKTIAVDSKAGALAAKAQQATERSQQYETDALARLQQAAKLYAQAAGLLRSAIAKAQDFISGLATVDTKGIALITKVAQEKAVCDALTKTTEPSEGRPAESAALLLMLDVRAAVGGYYTKKNLWTFFGGMPFFAMGGAVVTYTLLDSGGVIKAAGLVPVHSGYAKVDKVEQLVSTAVPRVQTHIQQRCATPSGTEPHQSGIKK